MAISMLFALTRSNLLRQLPDRNRIIPQFTDIVTVSNSIETYFGNYYKSQKRNGQNIIVR
jgi:hypothetical protein